MSEEEDYEYRSHWKEWHLTNAGWVAGSFKNHYDEETTLVARPADALKTVTVTSHSKPRVGVFYDRKDTWELRGSKRQIKTLEKAYTNGYRLTT